MVWLTNGIEELKLVEFVAKAGRSDPRGASRCNCKGGVAGSVPASTAAGNEQPVTHVLGGLKYRIKPKRRHTVEEHSQEESLINSGESGREAGPGNENHGEYVMVKTELEPGKQRENKGNEATRYVPTQVPW